MVRTLGRERGYACERRSRCVRRVVSTSTRRFEALSFETHKIEFMFRTPVSKVVFDHTSQGSRRVWSVLSEKQSADSVSLWSRWSLQLHHPRHKQILNISV